jgi:hypothetical protein
MASLYGTGCEKCNKEIAAALRDMPKMDGYLDATGFWNLYKDRESYDRPLARVNGVYMPHTFATVCGDDGWLLALHVGDDGRVGLCPNDPSCRGYDLWRGKVEIR